MHFVGRSSGLCATGLMIRGRSCFLRIWHVPASTAIDKNIHTLSYRASYLKNAFFYLSKMNQRFYITMLHFLDSYSLFFNIGWMKIGDGTWYRWSRWNNFRNEMILHSCIEKSGISPVVTQFHGSRTSDLISFIAASIYVIKCLHK